MTGQNTFQIGYEGWKQKAARQSKEASEGVNTTDFVRQGYLGETPGAVTKTEISVLDLLSEGRIDGLVTGYHTYVGTSNNTGWTTAALTLYDEVSSVRWLRSVFWNQVPVVNSNNEFNYRNINAYFTPGLPNGSVVDRVSSETTTVRPVGERLRYGPDFAKVYRVLNKNIKAIDINVKVNQLSRTETSPKMAGDIIDTEIEYNVLFRPLFSDITTEPFDYVLFRRESIRGKISFGYIRRTRIDLYRTPVNFSVDPNFLGWEIKLERLTQDSSTVTVRNQSFIDSIIEVYGDVFSYPNSAMVSAKFSAEYFVQVPSRNFEAKGLQVMVPTTYNPLTRSYSPNNGNDWDGTFKTDANGDIAKQWTDNPAWCYFDILTNRRYGLGRYITGADVSVDKWTLYNIARYCDVLVSDGYGKLEPRFSCNVYIGDRDEASKVINQMASVFRGITYYAAGTIFAVQDSPKNSYTEFTNANVENGDFIYSSSSKRVRHTVAIVRYNDKRNYYKPAVEYVEDIDGIRRYGIREMETVAFGATSRGQAVRFGKWALLTETSETETVNFTAGLEGTHVRPGDVIQISDSNRRGSRYGGRTYQLIDPSTILLDSQVSLASTQLYNFHLLTPTWTYDVNTISDLTFTDFSGFRKPHIQKQTFRGSDTTTVLGSDDVNRTRIVFPNSFDTGNHYYSGNLVWMIDSSGVSDLAYNILDYYRVIKVEEKDALKYNIAAVEYNANKYNQIESGLNFATQTIVDTAPTGPTNLILNLGSVSKTIRKIDYAFSIANTEGVAKYLVYVKKATTLSDSDVNTNQYLVNVLHPDIKNGTYIPDINSKYFFRVYSATSINTKSSTYASNEIIVSDINQAEGLVVQSLRLDPEGDPLDIADTSTPETNAPGSRQSATSITADPTFVWQLGSNDSSFISDFGLTGLGHRVTIRSPSNTNIPNKDIYYEEVVLTGRNDNLNFTFTFDKNKTVGPFRTYDVVVEAVNTHDGKSSAGGNYKGGDTKFSNSNGYDILAVTNPAINNFTLSDPTPQATDAYSTEQWITTDGNIKLWVKQGVPPDWAGGYAYVWTGLTRFTEQEANGLATTNKQIVRILFEGSGENGLITIPTGITGVSSAYLGISPGDTFDLARLEDNILSNTDLKMSNIVKIKKRLGFNEKLLFQNWVEVDLDYTNQTLTDWSKKSVGIKDITFESYEDPLDSMATRYKHHINFAVPLAENNYVVVAPNTGVNVREGSKITKNIDGVVLERFKGEQFLGVLYNGE